ncbi:MAG: WhiB family transcriptional regulator [Candidatus Saccharimonadales bacterium]
MKPQRSRAEIDAALAQHLAQRAEQTAPIQHSVGVGATSEQPLTTDWQAQRACTLPGVEPELFDTPLPGEQSRERERRERAAKTICRTCPVSVLCLTEALQIERAAEVSHQPGLVLGIRSGLNYSERRQLGARRPRVGLR